MKRWFVVAAVAALLAPAALESIGARTVERLQRDVERAGQTLVLVLVFW